MSRHFFVRTLFASFGLLLLTLPLVSLAQENQPQPGGYCPRITQDLKRGDCDEGIVSQACKRHVPNSQVTELQKFLASYYENYPDEYITGKFLFKTQQFVQTFQREQNLPAYGYVGPLTRAAIARVCGTQTSLPQCTPEQPQTQTNLCPAGQTGSITQTRTSTCPGPVWGAWLTTGNTCSTPGNNASCTFNNQTIAHSASVTAYQTSSVAYGSQCVSQQRTCSNGTLSGTYQYATCSVATATCTPENPQTQTLSCPTGQTGSIIQTRTSTCPGPTWGAWTTTSNTCTTPPSPPTNVGACTYKGQTYVEGQSVTVPFYGSYASWVLACDNAVWVFANGDPFAKNPAVAHSGQNVCDVVVGDYPPYYMRADVACSGSASTKAFLSVIPRHGKAPLTVTAVSGPAGFGSSYTLSWGDETFEYLPHEPYRSEINNNPRDTSTHTYASPGSYTISYSITGLSIPGVIESGSNSATIRVDGPIASANNSTQLAAALAALESALQAILSLLQ